MKIFNETAKGQYLAWEREMLIRMTNPVMLDWLYQYQWDIYDVLEEIDERIEFPGAVA